MDPATERVTPELMVERHRGRVRKLDGRRLYLDVHRRAIPGLVGFGGLVEVDDPLPLTFAEQYALTEATAELATCCYADVLLLQAMGLDGWMFDGIDRFAMLARRLGPPQRVRPRVPVRHRRALASAQPDRPGRGLRGLQPTALPRHGCRGGGLRRAQVRSRRPVPPRNSRCLDRQPSFAEQRPDPRPRVQGLRGDAGSVRLRHLRQVLGDGSVGVHHELRPGSPPGPRLLRPVLQTWHLPAHPRRTHATLARRAGEDRREDETWASTYAQATWTCGSSAGEPGQMSCSLPG